MESHLRINEKLDMTVLKKSQHNEKFESNYSYGSWISKRVKSSQEINVRA